MLFLNDQLKSSVRSKINTTLNIVVSEKVAEAQPTVKLYPAFVREIGNNQKAKKESNTGKNNKATNQRNFLCIFHPFFMFFSSLKNRLTHLKRLLHSHRVYPVLTKEKNIGGIKKWK